MQDLDALRAYLTDPGRYWPEGAGQAARLETRLAELEAVLNADRPGVVDELVAAGRFRSRFAARSIYIDSLGHSGSRWLMAMLGEMIDVLPAGEIYLPQELFEELIRPSKRERRAIVQGVYAAHAWRPDLGLITAHAINTCHTTSVYRYARHDGDALKILLTRDPADLALARALRRDGEAPSADPHADLEAAITKVHEFFNYLKLEEFDLVFRYEELIADPATVLGSIMAALNQSVDGQKLALATEAEGRDADDFRPAVEIPGELETRAREGLVPIAAKLGY